MTHDRKAYFAAYRAAHRDTERARANAWYRANRERHKATAAERYRTKRPEVLATVARYRVTAAGMLNDTRHHAKQRGNR